jgi:hypothetical protein
VRDRRGREGWRGKTKIPSPVQASIYLAYDIVPEALAAACLNNIDSTSPLSAFAFFE